MTNTFKLKKGLGRGLSSLIGDTNTELKSNKISNCLTVEFFKWNSSFGRNQ